MTRYQITGRRFASYNTLLVEWILAEFANHDIAVEELNVTESLLRSGKCPPGIVFTNIKRVSQDAVYVKVDINGIKVRDIYRIKNVPS